MLIANPASTCSFHAFSHVPLVWLLASLLLLDFGCSI